jgi:hypothetical protein
MRATAELARFSTVEQCKADAKSYVEYLKTNTDAQTQGLRKASEADIVTIRERSKARVERIRAETEQRIARRRDLLDQELQEYNAAIETEIERVERSVAAFESEVSAFFEQLLQGADPTAFATMASQMPDPPTFADLDGQSFANELRARREAAARPSPVESGGNGAGERVPEQLPDFWWLDSPATLAARSKPEDER